MKNTFFRRNPELNIILMAFLVILVSVALSGCSIFPADTLPGGWTWHCWNDGSGHLESPAGNSLFSYDTNPYANCGEIEYRKDRNSGWTTFEGSLTSFRQFAEEVILKQMQR